MKISIFLICACPLAVAQTPGTFTATGNMTTARSGHTATLLPDGRVLIAGGDVAGSAELYDPATANVYSDRQHDHRTIRAHGDVAPQRQGPDRRGRMAAGQSAELYDPSTGTFSATGTMNYAPVGHTATLLADGRVLIAAGSSTR